MVFEYLTVLISVVVGLALTHFLTQLVRIIHVRDRVVVSWAQLLWALALLVWIVSFWWFTFALNTVETWTFGLFLFVLGYAVFLDLLMALLFPEGEVPNQDYRAQFIRNRHWFFGTLLAFVSYDLVDYWIKAGTDSQTATIGPYALFIGPLIVMTVIALGTRNLLFHRFFAAMALVWVVAMSVITLRPLGA